VCVCARARVCVGDRERPSSLGPRNTKISMSTFHLLPIKMDQLSALTIGIVSEPASF
jgi:hypothetical protein